MVLDTKSNAKVKLDNGNTKKVSCFKFYNETIKRELMVHANIDHKNKSTLSDVKTGLRFFDVNTTIEKLKMDHLEEPLQKFITHYTIGGIAEEFKKHEEIQ